MGCQALSLAGRITGRYLPVGIFFLPIARRPPGKPDLLLAFQAVAERDFSSADRELQRLDPRKSAGRKNVAAGEKRARTGTAGYNLRLFEAGCGRNDATGNSRKILDTANASNYMADSL